MESFSTHCSMFGTMKSVCIRGDGVHCAYPACLPSQHSTAPWWQSWNQRWAAVGPEANIIIALVEAASVGLSASVTGSYLPGHEYL